MYPSLRVVKKGEIGRKEKRKAQKQKKWEQKQNEKKRKLQEFMATNEGASADEEEEIMKESRLLKKLRRPRLRPRQRPAPSRRRRALQMRRPPRRNGRPRCRPIASGCCAHSRRNDFKRLRGFPEKDRICHKLVPLLSRPRRTRTGSRCCRVSLR